jgi:hypothetical protein
MIDRILPKVGALIVIVGGLGLRYYGIDAEVWSLVLIATGFLFGTTIAEMRSK